MDVLFTPHPADVELLAQEGTAWQPISHRMMIDTGAALTIVEDPVPQFLQLAPIRFQAIAGVTGDLDCPVYRLQINIRSSSHDDRRSSSLQTSWPYHPCPTSRGRMSACSAETSSSTSGSSTTVRAACIS